MCVRRVDNASPVDMYYLFCFMLLLFASPLMVVISVIIACADGLPVIFRQKRIGKHGQEFVIYKFRTMKRDSELRKKQLLRKNEANGPVFKIRNDPRFTVVGKFLAHTGLDELPQLFNVLKGDMAIIGPRPLPVDESKKLASWQRERLAINPGIISPWVLEGYHRQTFDAWMKSDIAYSKRKSLIYDVSLFFRTCGFLATLLWREMIR